MAVRRTDKGRDMGKKKQRGARPTARRGAAATSPPASPADTLEAEPAEQTYDGVIIAGIGASAGGLEAFTELLHALPAEPGLALVLLQHQAPQHQSALTEILRAQSLVPVVAARDGMRVEPNHAYVNPPNTELRILDGKLRLTPRPTDPSQYTPIDVFLRSLAAFAQDRAIAVVLSGTASDGASGVREIKAAGGIAIAQQPQSARYDGMPRAAIATDLVDLVLQPREIAEALVRIGLHPFPGRSQERPGRKDAGAEQTRDSFERILTLLRSGAGVDFRQYKRPTIERRVHRRMALQRLTTLDQYVRLLEQNPNEIQVLFEDVLILVTRFFRDPEVFEALRSHAIPTLIAAHNEDDPVRVWIAGCSTGEEAYSVAILLQEVVGDLARPLPVQVFATDISERAIEVARRGVYPSSIAADVSPGRLRRFFTEVEGGYAVAKSVRDACVFARQDLTRDPPFSKLDLVVCRNVLIYLNPPTQQKLMNLFHYALRPTGLLMLGTAETIGQHSELFRIEDKRARLYARRATTTAHPSQPVKAQIHLPTRSPVTARVEREDPRVIETEATRLIQERFAPPGVIVDAELQIVQFRGHTGAFLEPPAGEPSTSLLKMARDGLVYGLRAATQTAKRTHAAVRRGGIRVKRPDGWHEVELEVLPLGTAARPHFLVLFHDGSTVPPEKPSPRRTVAKRTHPPEDGDHERELARLQHELASSGEYLQSMIQDLEAANEELQSANEEILSANEELQSTNEELDTAREELQSTNEELNTVNDELRGRNEDLSRANSDLENLLASIHVAIVIVSRDLRIRRFTPMAERVLNLIPTDVGRPIGHIQPNVDCPDLERRILEVLDSMVPHERGVRDRAGNFFTLRIRPYKDLDNRIDGAVLTLFSTQAGQQHEDSLLELRRHIETVSDLVKTPLALLDARLTIHSANGAFARLFGVSAAAALDHTPWELVHGATAAALRSALQRGLAEGAIPLERVLLEGRLPRDRFGE